MSLMIKLGSVTNAQRAQKKLSEKGYSSRLSRLQNPKSGDGCGYALKINSKDRERIVSLLENGGINILGVEEI